MTLYNNSGQRALVTGDAGPIGSHIADLLLREGWSVRILDALEPQTHRLGKPAWIPDAAEFVQGDIREYFTAAEAILRQKRVVQRVTP